MEFVNRRPLKDWASWRQFSKKTGPRLQETAHRYRTGLQQSYWLVDLLPKDWKCPSWPSSLIMWSKVALLRSWESDQQSPSPNSCKKPVKFGIDAGTKVSDVDIWEINEAFASQATYCVEKLGINKAKLNPKGGAIALGHPLGCTGSRQIATLLP